MASMKPVVYVAGDTALGKLTRYCCRMAHDTATSASWANVVWICHEPTVDPASGEPDTKSLIAKIAESILPAPIDARIVISSPCPVGTTAALRADFPNRMLFYSPENMKHASKPEDFMSQPRIVVGTTMPDKDDLVASLMAPFTGLLLWMDIPSAEMVKSALNGYLAMSITYANEIEILCNKVSANPTAVIEALKRDPRIGEKAYITPGNRYGLHLAREIWNLNQIAQLPLISGIKHSHETSGS